jgi:hypothetical protein
MTREEKRFRRSLAKKSRGEKKEEGRRKNKKKEFDQVLY